ncbi:unnamed protein product [Didymodactylos carnosus]|uniref:J domain-containing protein n=1 Tax=Didymodactylos carnosus TaxID=1234261 RepID=A0A813SJP0_9BILA|nr:unnamed protein product [Didymodactylos carnosus]CAF0852121.1 unnamed protein product [Didymodactylos carnosus]CAF3582801.1 unnamed protein product [Didymodactylos carnosus]CAF3637322.1 unnamed protein product [Didymodactylos carnosus]
MVAQTLDFYSVLGIKKNANDTEIKKAFYKKAREWHPDKNSQPCAEEKFKEVNKAYETLSDANKRRTYDLQQTDATSTKTSTTTKSTPTQQQQKSSNSDFQTTFTSSFHHSGEPHFTFSTTTNGNNNGRFPFHRMDDDNLFSRHSRFPYSFFDSFGTSMNDDFFFNFSDEHNTDDDEDSDDDHHNSTINSDEFDFNLRNERRKMPHQQSRRTHRNRSKWGNSWGLVFEY